MTHEGRSVIVTGAAAGLGRATTRRLVADGAQVVAVDIAGPGLHELASELGDAVTPVVGSVAAPADIDHIVSVATSVTGRIDALVNNAAVLDRLLTIGECDDETWERVLAINLGGPFRLCRKVVPLMVDEGGGSIVNVSSVAGVRGFRGGVAYTASKHALIGLTRNIAASHGGAGIRCNAVCPGGMNTEIGRQERSPLGEETIARTVTPGAVRVAEPEEVADVICFLLSDAARNMNGAVVVADGGWTVP